MNRIDPFLSAHKALRVAMFDVATHLARTDFAQPAAGDAAVAPLRRTLAFLEQHAEHEERTILPALARHCPELARGLASEHAALAWQEAKVAQLAARLAGAAPAQRPAIGRRLAGQWHRLVSSQLAHMEREEDEASRVLQAHATEAELDAMQIALLAAVSAEERPAWEELMRRALSAPEQEKRRARIAAEGARA